MADMKYTVKVDTQGAVKSVDKLGNSFGALKKLGAAAAVAAVAKAIYEAGKLAIDTTKKFETYENQLRLITDGSDDLAATMDILAQAAVKNRASFADTVDLYAKLTLATAELGVESEDVLTVTTKLSQALAVAGADASTTSSVVRQFGQAMASGTVRGDEFNSLVEGLGPALAIMAEETGLNVGELRKMSREGELTAEVMFDMLQNSESLTAAFNAQVTTLEQLETAFGDSFDRAIRKLAETTGVADLYRDALKRVTRELDQFSGVAGLTNASLDELKEGFEEGKFSANDLTNELTADIDDIIRELNRLGAFGEIRLPIDPNSSIPIQGTVEELKKLIDGTYEVKSAFIDAGVLFRDVGAFLGFVEKSTADLTEEQIEQARAMLEMLDRYAELAEAETEAAKLAKENKERVEEQKEAYDKWTASVSGLVEAIEDQKQTQRNIDTGKYLTEMEKAEKAVQDAKDQVQIFTDAIASLKDGSSGLDDAAARVTNLEEDLILANVALAETEKALAKLQEPAYTAWLDDLIEKSKRTVEEQGFVTQALKDLEDQLKSGALTLNEYNEAVDAITEAKDAFQELLDVLDGIETMEEFEAAQARINQAFDDGKINIDEYREALDELRDKYEELDPVAAAFKDALNDAGDTLADDLVEGKDALDSFKDFFKNIVKDMIKEAIKLFFIKNLLGGIAGAFGYDLGFTGSSITSITKRAKGGPVNNSQPYMVGEQGPELFVPNSAGNIVPNDQLGGSSGPVTNNYITNNISALDSKSVAQVFAENRQSLLGTVEYARKETAYGV